jgi:tetrahydromethanopterin S-methyltransferase subunit G
LYPIEGKGSAKHLLDVGVEESGHQDAMKRVVHHFGLEKFGANAGESILCETLPGRNVFDAFFVGQHLFLLNSQGQLMFKEYSSMGGKNVGRELGFLVGFLLNLLENWMVTHLSTSFRRTPSVLEVPPSLLCLAMLLRTKFQSS